MSAAEALLVPDLPTQWREALDHWSHAIDLALPLQTPEGDSSVAWIDLADRQTRVNFEKLRQLGVLDRVRCILAHEVGHHIRFPHTVAEARRMLRFHREAASEVFSVVGAPKDAWDWMLNVFHDLLINDELSESYEDDFIAIFGALRQPDWRPSFTFYLGIFEELWSLPAHSLVSEEHDADLRKIDPRWRTRARVTGEFVRAHPENRPLQLVRFLVALRPFVKMEDAQPPEGGGAFERRPLSGDQPLDGDAIADLMRRRGDEEAARRWLREQAGGKKKGNAPAAAGGGGGDPLTNARLALQDLAPPEEVAIAVYRRESSRATLEIPASLEPGEPVLPGPYEPWELGDDLDALDWTGSVVRAGGLPIAGIHTVTRTRLPDEPRPGEREAPWIELYIDSSGSMPNPQASYSHQIEAGFVLVDAATRAGGRVRVVQYSSIGQRIAMPEFTRTARPAHVALVQYIGGGTDFPWDELKRSVERFRNVARVRRVVLSDSDFHANVGYPNPAVDVEALVRTAAAVGGITAILNTSAVHPGLTTWGMEQLSVVGWQNVSQAARALADTLFRSKVRSKP